MQLPTSLPGLLNDALVWIVAAAVVRLGVQFLLATHPALWPPVVLLLMTPLILAAYQAAFVSKSGLLLGYRLLLIMVGLLLGGRFLVR